MLDDRELLQGAVLRQLILGAIRAVSVAPFKREGHVNSFVVDELVGIFVKHSTKRMSPWLFTFHLDHARELSEIRSAHPDTFVALVCGTDGVATIDMSSLYEIVTFESSRQAWIRVARKPRSMYAVTGNGGELQRKIARGVAPVLAILQDRTLGSLKNVERASQDHF